MTIQIQDSVTSLASGLKGAGSVAARLLASNFNVNALRTLGTLKKDEWIHYDSAVVEVARERLIGVSDLVSRGMTYPLNNALGSTRVEWERMSDMDPAAISMSGISESQNDRITFDLQGMPVPIVHKDFNINIRALMASRNSGQPLDTTQVRLATRKVAETIEGMLFSGATVLGSNNPIYGYTTAVNRNTGALAASWQTATGAQIIGDVLDMIEAANADNMYGPYVIYVNNLAFINLSNDYKLESDKTILQRIKEIPGIADVRPTNYLPIKQVIMVQMTSDVVDMIDGMSPTLVEWESHGGMVMHFKVMAIMLPRIRTDILNQSGLMHFTAP